MTRLLPVACVASAALHGVLGWALLRPPTQGSVPPPALPPELEVEFVAQPAEVAGVSAAVAAAPPAAAETTPPAPTEDGTEAVPPQSSPAPARPVPPGPATPVRVAVLGGDEDRESLLVTGDNVVPPRPDATVRNRPPSYPAAAVRRHAQGVVGLVVHVTETGVPAWVEVRDSSGDASLDDAARDAVALWHFRPALSDGRAVPFDFEYNIRFTLGTGRRGPDGQDRPRFDPGG